MISYSVQCNFHPLRFSCRYINISGVFILIFIVATLLLRHLWKERESEREGALKESGLWCSVVIFFFAKTFVFCFHLLYYDCCCFHLAGLLALVVVKFNLKTNVNFPQRFIYVHTVEVLRSVLNFSVNKKENKAR